MLRKLLVHAPWNRSCQRGTPQVFAHLVLRDEEECVQLLRASRAASQGKAPEAFQVAGMFPTGYAVLWFHLQERAPPQGYLPVSAAGQPPLKKAK